MSEHVADATALCGAIYLACALEDSDATDPMTDGVRATAVPMVAGAVEHAWWSLCPGCQQTFLDESRNERDIWVLQKILSGAWLGARRDGPS